MTHEVIDVVERYRQGVIAAIDQDNVLGNSKNVNWYRMEVQVLDELLEHLQEIFH